MTTTLCSTILGIDGIRTIEVNEVDDIQRVLTSDLIICYNMRVEKGTTHNGQNMHIQDEER